jgi:hypothetical protein
VSVEADYLTGVGNLAWWKKFQYQRQLPDCQIFVVTSSFMIIVSAPLEPPVKDVTDKQFIQRLPRFAEFKLWRPKWR